MGVMNDLSDTSVVACTWSNIMQHGLERVQDVAYRQACNMSLANRSVTCDASCVKLILSSRTVAYVESRVSFRPDQLTDGCGKRTCICDGPVMYDGQVLGRKKKNIKNSLVQLHFFCSFLFEDFEYNVLSSPVSMYVFPRLPPSTPEACQHVCVPPSTPQACENSPFDQPIAG